MPRSWSSRWHAPASPMAMPSATRQPQPQPQPHPHPHPHQKHHHHQPQQSGQQLHRMTSFTHRLRSRKPVSPTAATSSHIESAPQTHDPAPPASAQLRQHPAYVPTHAAASFARTVSPLSTTRIDEQEEELACNEPASKMGNGLGTTSTWMHSTACAAGGDHVCASSYYPTCPSTTTAADSHAATRNTSRNGSRVRGHRPAACSHRATRPRTEAAAASADDDDDNSDYATFLAEAEAHHRAVRSHWAQREQELEQQWAALNNLPPPGFKGITQRDSAYYSAASLSRSSVSGRGSGLKLAPQKQAQVLPGPRSAPLPASGSASTPSSPQTLNHKPSKTLGRRISEYFRPSSFKTSVTTIA